MADTDWSQLLEYESSTDAFSKFYKMHINIYNKAFPLKRVKKKYRNRLPWLSSDLKSKIKTKNEAYKTKLQHPTSYNCEKYRDLRNKVSYEIRKEEKTYYQKLLTENKNNLRKTWQIIKGVISKNKRNAISRSFTVDSTTITDEKIIADRFNDFFINIGPNLASKIPNTNSDFKNYLPQANTNSIYLEPITEYELEKIILSLKNGAPGYDDITLDCIKCAKDSIIKPLTYLINLSFQDGVFPDELKLAKVVPLYKANDPKILKF